MREKIEVGYQAFVSDGSEGFGAVREVFRSGLIVYVENAGDFVVPLTAVEAVQSQKVIFDRGKLDRRLQEAIKLATRFRRPDAWPVVGAFHEGPSAAGPANQKTNLTTKGTKITKVMIKNIRTLRDFRGQ
jgi:hypothetical protein